MRRLPDRDRIATIAAEHLRAAGHGEPKLLKAELVTLDPKRREMLAFIRSQQLNQDERRKVLTLYRSRPRQEWSLHFLIRFPKSTQTKSVAIVKLDLEGKINDVLIFARPRGAA